MHPLTAMARFGGGIAATGALILMLGSGAAQARMPDGFADLAEKLTPAVVNIATTRAAAQAQGSTSDSGTPFDDFFHDFFGDRDNGDGDTDRAPGGGNENKKPAPRIPGPLTPRIQSLG